MSKIFYPVEKIEELIKSIMHYQSTIVKKLPPSLHPKILGKFTYKNISDLSFDQFKLEFYNVIYNAGLRKEFGITLQYPEFSEELEGIHVAPTSIHSIITYIQDLLFFRQILDLDTKKKIKLVFGKVGEEKDENGNPVEDFQYCSV